MTTVSQEAREAAENFMNAHGWLCEEDWSLVLEADREVIVKFFAKFEQSIRQSAERGEVVAWQDVITERRRQIEKEGWSFEHDDAHEWGQMAGAAVCYALTNVGHWAAGPAIDQFWPWDKAWWKPTDKRRNLVKAAALLLAEIERIDRSRHLSKPEEA